MLFDTHCHLQSKRLSKKLEHTLNQAYKADVRDIMIPATHPDEFKTIFNLIESSKKINSNIPKLYPAIGIHPIWFNSQPNHIDIKPMIQQLSNTLKKQHITTIGEIGLDHQYPHPQQIQLFESQVQIAAQKKLNLILHNRESTDQLIKILTENWTDYFSGHIVFHCCAPEKKLLQFAKEKQIYLGFDGDITYNQTKQHFIKQVPLHLLVLETDSPHLLPEPLKTQKLYPNQPANLKITTEFVSKLLNTDYQQLAKITTQNAKQLFKLKN